MSIFTIKQIFQDNWESFAQNNPVRLVVLHEVAKMLGCGDLSNGFTQYTCPHCGRFLLVPFRCHSRFCNTCFSAYQEDRASFIAAKMVKCRHRHIVFTIAEELRPYFLKDRSLLNVLFRTAADVLLRWFYELNHKEHFEPGIVAGLHTFGRDLKWNPHIHILVSEGAAGKTTPWKNFHYFPFRVLRKSWMTGLLKNLKAALNPKLFNITQFKNLTNFLYQKYKEGFYVNAPATDFNNPRAVANYITRYISRPAMSQSRITAYDGKNVTFWYRRHEDNQKVTVTVSANEFIKMLIIHIPSRGFNMLRYYGIYAKPFSSSQHLIRILSHQQFMFYRKHLRKWQIRFEIAFKRSPLKCTCGHFMSFFEIYFPGCLPQAPPSVLKWSQ